MVWLDRVASKLARATQSTRVLIVRELVRSIRASVRRTGELEREIGALVATKAPSLLEIPGCGILTAAKIISETAGIERMGSDAKLTRLAGVAPVPVSSGRKDRHRLDRGGNGQLNCGLHRIAVTQGRVDERARAYLAKKQPEGKSRMEALRCLKRQLARRVWQALRADGPPTSPSLPDSRELRPVRELALT